MGKANRKLNGSSENGSGSKDVEKSETSITVQQPRSLEILRARPKTSSDLATLMFDAVYDNIVGSISVGQGNLILNMAGKVIQTKKLELQLGSAKRVINNSPFELPGN